VATFRSPTSGNGTIVLVFHPRGTTGRAGDYRLILWALRNGSGTYWLKLQPPGGAPPTLGAQPVGFGQLGMSTRQVAILVQTRLPDWVQNPRTPWRIVVR
jgi:hypothetical protein